MDDVELDNERHRREEQERRAKRHKNKETKSKSGHLSEKERKRREHAQRILGAQKKKPPLPSQPSSSHLGGSGGGSSVFQSLFLERAEGFFVDLRFRNAPPRPPVGPTFVGLGLEGELTNKWTKYKARNAVENQYTWKLHPERDLGVPLAVSAMDYEGCYTDPAKNDDTVEKDKRGNDDKKKSKPKLHLIQSLHPEDESLINWKGSKGDTAAEQLQQKQDRVRAAARLAVSQGYGSMPSKSQKDSPSSIAGGVVGVTGAFRLKKHHLMSRILDEATPNFMKKTTYLTNDATSVHQFTSLAHTQVQRAKDVDKALAETKTKYSEMDMIERGFNEANAWDIFSVVNEDVTGDVVHEKRRTHPSKKGLQAVWDLPLLPDVPAWGHTYTHVVLDNPPKNITSKSPANKNSESSDFVFKAEQLCRAIVADVTKHAENKRMACTVWAPESPESSKLVSKSESSEQPTKKSKKGHEYRAFQQYDLDVVPLRDPSGPHVQYVWAIDLSKNYVGYHSVGSRIQLSTGRPIVLSGKPHRAHTAEMTTNQSYIFHREMDEEEKKDFELKMAMVDVDLAEKYGMEEEDGFAKEGTREKEGWGQKNLSTESESDEMEADAF